MRKLVLGILIGITVLTLSGIAAAVAEAPTAAKAKPQDLEKIEFIHWKKDFVRPDLAKAQKPTSCYKFLTPKGVRWPETVTYVINPTNPQELRERFVTDAISTAAETWDAATSGELTNNNYTLGYSAVYGVYDGKNAIVFGNYPTSGVIAVTSIWYNRITNTIVEFDMMFDTDWTWGDASSDSSKMDLQNIATHEFGHAVGLGDLYQSACSAVTMYGYSNYGDIEKRSLAQPDITGLRSLYGY